VHLFTMTLSSPGMDYRIGSIMETAEHAYSQNFQLLFFKNTNFQQHLRLQEFYKYPYGSRTHEYRSPPLDTIMHLFHPLPILITYAPDIHVSVILSLYKSSEWTSLSPLRTYCGTSTKHEVPRYILNFFFEI
jgi:hypothetical protein